jgi:hypothetical protein
VEVRVTLVLLSVEREKPAIACSRMVQQ